MSENFTLQFNRRLCPTSNPGSIMMFGQAIAEYLRTGDPDYLPPGVTVVEIAVVPVNAA